MDLAKEQIPDIQFELPRLPSLPIEPVIKTQTKAKLRVVSPHREVAYGKAVEVFGDRFAVLRMPVIDRGDAGLVNQIQVKLGMPVIVLGAEQELELVEIET